MGAQAQAVAVDAATAQQSLTCVKCLVQLAVHQIAGLRGLFPEDAFKRRDIAGLRDVMELDGDFSHETRLVCDWVDRGVNDALAKRCLRSMTFSISDGALVPEVLEQFVFDFAFSSSGAATMEVSTKARGADGETELAASVKATSLDNLRKQACNLLRSLIAAISTLGPVPEERELSIKLSYTDDVDRAYEPPGFVAASPDSLGVFAREPSTLCIGNLKSEHHAVRLRVRSVLDIEDCGPMAILGDPACLRSIAGGISQPDAQLTQSDARVLSAKPGAVNGADEGYDSDVTRDVAPRKVAAAATPAVATALPATRRSARTQKADAQDIVEKLSCLQTAEPSVGGNKKKRGAAPESQYESQAKRPRKVSAPAQPIRQRTAAPVDLFSAR